MDRIKQALDKARAERGEKLTTTAPKSGDRSRSVSDISGDQQHGIQYSQTRIETPAPAVLANNLISYEHGDRKGLAAYKMLRTQVLQRMTSKGWNTVAVTSPNAREGKTLTAINLAISMARELHHTVLLVDMDLRNPSIHKYFGLKIETGIDEFLLNGAPLEDILINPGIERLVLLPCKNPVENSSELLASPPMGRLVQELKSRYPSRIVLFDLPPVLEADDALSFAPFADAFLLVLRDGKTTRTALEHAMELLKNTVLLGTVLNDSEEKISAYY